MTADRRVDAAGGLRQLGAQGGVQRLAHAVQPLEFKAVDTAGRLDHARDGQRVMRRELRKDPRPRVEQFSGAFQVAKVGHRLAREDRIIGKPALLRALDLGVPIGALHQPHHQAAIERVRAISTSQSITASARF